MAIVTLRSLRAPTTFAYDVQRLDAIISATFAMLPVDVTFAYLWLALSVMAILSGLVAEYRNASFWSWVIVAGGVSLLGWSAYNVHPTLILARSGSNIVKLQQEVAFREREIVRLHHAEKTAWEMVEIERASNAVNKTQIGDLKKEIKRSQEEFREERSRYSESKASLETLLGATQLKISELERRASASENDLKSARAQVVDKHELYASSERNRDNDRKQHSHQTASIASELAAERTQNKELQEKLAKNEQDLAKKEATPEASAHKDKLLPESLEGELYSATVLQDREIVAGRIGSYYAIRFRDPAGLSIPLFDIGSYQLSAAASEQFLAAIGEFKDKLIYSLLDKPATILVRGRANNLSLRRRKTLAAGKCVAEGASYLPYDVTLKRYLSNRKDDQSFADVSSNQELANIRAAVISCDIATKITNVKIEILEGEIVDASDRAALAVDIMLFVNQ